MSGPTMQSSHPLVGRVFVVLGLVGLVWSGAAYWLGCNTAGIPAWPPGSEHREILDSIASAALPLALVSILGVLLPLQRWARDPRYHARLARAVTAVLMVQLGVVWVIRLNRLGFASLWSRRETVGDLVLPAAVLENRVWSANIMLVLLVALLSLPVHRWFRSGLDRSGVRRPHWSLWVIAGSWWVGLCAVVLLAARA